MLAGALLFGATAVEAAAHPPTPVGREGRELGGAVHRWFHQAKVPLVKGRLQVLRRSCPRHPGFEACVFTSRPRRIYLRRGLRDPRRLLYHELGHVFDLKVLNRRERRAFKRIVGVRGRGWYGRGAEWFADGYMYCALTRSLGRRPRRATPYGYRPRPRTHRRVCRLIRRAAAPRGRPPQPPRKPPPVIDSQPPAPPSGGSPPPPQGEPPCGFLERLFTGCRAR